MVSIRHANSSDNVAISAVQIASIRELCRSHYDPADLEVWAERRTPEFFSRVLESQELFVAEREGRVVGWGQLDLETGTVHSIYVAPEAAGHGVGSKLIAHLEAIAVQHGWKNLHLIATLNAIAFCEKMGYEQAAPFGHRVSEAITLPCFQMRKRLPLH